MREVKNLDNIVTNNRWDPAERREGQRIRQRGNRGQKRTCGTVVSSSKKYYKKEKNKMSGCRTGDDEKKAKQGDTVQNEERGIKKSNTRQKQRNQDLPERVY